MITQWSSPLVYLGPYPLIRDAVASLSVTAFVDCSITIGALPPAPDVLTLEAWTQDISDLAAIPLNLPVQFTTNDGTVIGDIDGSNNVFILATDQLVTDFLLFWNGVGMTEFVDYRWTCSQPTSAGPWITTITMIAGQIPRPSDVLTAEVFAE